MKYSIDAYNRDLKEWKPTGLRHDDFSSAIRALDKAALHSQFTDFRLTITEDGRTRTLAKRIKAKEL